MMSLHVRVLMSVLSVVLPPSVREGLRGDLEELYRERASSSGRWRAAGWLVGQVMNASVRYAPRRLAAVLGTMRVPLTDLRGVVRTSARQMLSAPGFTTVVIVLVALGVGLNVTVFSLVDGILLTPMPYPAPERIVSVSEDNPKIQISPGWTSVPNFVDIEERARGFDAMALFRGRSISVGTDGDPEYAYGTLVSSDFFDVFGVQPALGRTFTTSETQLSGEPVVILSHGLWERGYGRDPDILGRSILVDGTPHVVAGVMPEGFNAPGEWIGAGVAVALWRPFPMNADNERGNRSYSAVARLSAGTTLAAARVEVEGVHRQLRAAFPDADGEWRSQVLEWGDLVVRGTQAPLLLLLGTMLLVLAIACANVASLTTTRILGRRRELATRVALGAPRGRILLQLLAEVVLLVGVGGVVGVVVGRLGLVAIKAVGPSLIPRLAAIELDGSVLAFALLITAVAAVAVGGVAAVLATRGDPAARLRESTIGPSVLGWRLRGSLAVIQLVMSFVLLAGATLLVVSFRNLDRTDLGFETERVTSMTVALSWDRVATQEERTAFTRDVLHELARIPGVESAAMINSLPLSGSRSFTRVDIDGRTEEGRGPALAIRGISPGYQETLAIPMLEGRAFESADVDTPSSALVNERAAALHWPDRSPIGERVRVGPGPWLTVVGVVRNVLHDGAGREILPELYIPYSLETLTSKSFVVRSSGPPAAVATQLRDALRRVDAQQPVREIRSMDDWVARATAVPRFQATLMGAAAALATLLAGIGLFAALASVVRERRREIAVRVALGAQKRGVLGLVSRKALILVVPGLAGGALFALAAGRLLESFLVGVEPRSPLVFGLVTGALLLTAGLAIYLPASTAARLDPATVLRDE